MFYSLYKPSPNGICLRFPPSSSPGISALPGLFGHFCIGFLAKQISSANWGFHSWTSQTRVNNLVQFILFIFKRVYLSFWWCLQRNSPRCLLHSTLGCMKDGDGKIGKTIYNAKLRPCSYHPHVHAHFPLQQYSNSPVLWLQTSNFLGEAPILCPVHFHCDCAKRFFLRLKP